MLTNLRLRCKKLMSLACKGDAATQLEGVRKQLADEHRSNHE